MMKKFFRQKNAGFTLVETLVAISIFSLSILGLLVVLSQGIADTGYAKKKMAAAYLAQEGIEYARNKRDTFVLYTLDTGWSSFISSNVEQGLPAPEDTSFTRLVSKQILGENEVKIISTVTWNQGSGIRSITFSENLYNWME